MSKKSHDWMIRLMQGYAKVHGPEKLIACVQAAIADPVDKALLGAAVECEHQSQMEGWYEWLRIPGSLPVLGTEESTTQKEAVMSALETVCPHCDGRPYSSGNCCRECNGSGVVPTDFGQRVLNLVDRHFVALLKNNE